MANSEDTRGHLSYRTWCKWSCFESNLNVGAYRHSDDTTGAVWRCSMFFFCCFITSKESIPSYFDCIGICCNTIYPWNSKSKEERKKERKKEASNLSLTLTSRTRKAPCWLLGCSSSSTALSLLIPVYNHLNTENIRAAHNQTVGDYKT